MKRKCVVYDVTIYLLEGKFILWNKPNRRKGTNIIK